MTGSPRELGQSRARPDGELIRRQERSTEDDGTQILIRHAENALSLPLIPNQVRVKSQKPLEEDTYIDGLEYVIKRDFYPDIFVKDEQTRKVLEWQRATEEDDHSAIGQLEADFGRRTLPAPTPKGHTGMETPQTSVQSRDETIFVGPDRVSIPKSMTLQDYQNTFTSEDNDSFLHILHKENASRRSDMAWAYVAARRANLKRLDISKNESMAIEGSKNLLEAPANGEASPKLLTQYSAEKELHTSATEQIEPFAKSGIITMREIGSKAGGIQLASDEEAPKSTSKILPHSYAKVQNKLFFPLSSEESPSIPPPDTASFLQNMGRRDEKRVSYKNTRFRTKRRKVPSTPGSSRIDAALRGDISSIGGDLESVAQDIDTASVAGDTHAAGATEVLTWGNIEATPLPLNGTNERMYAVPNTSKRDELHRRLASEKIATKKARPPSTGPLGDRLTSLKTPIFDSYSPRQASSNAKGSAGTPYHRQSALTPAARALMSKLPASSPKAHTKM